MIDAYTIMMVNNQFESIVLGGGCFWCLDAAYKLVKGVVKVEEGYSGGKVGINYYDQIDIDITGHAEVVKITYDPNIISLKDILDIFWTIHDPTTLNRQGYDEGPQYRSIIFYSNSNQKAVIEKSLLEAQKVWDNKIVTKIEKFEKFFPASEYHKNYEIYRPDYCQLIINPKLEKLRQKFAARIA
jgi:methionine-S-sulfoxide reductase